ncbi:deleted in azoospermia protein 2-like isoform X1 [Dreissena polymorpha]|uniref:deleted in azoospermia protein 2-like isoform X1 n=1 Tax=Dreissena polymorpha TaxID=45954 RepID=UPI0022656E4F|nr:deleted in azoospermia protein 2-like isoform X1 [Dreissena polymorpha]
MDYYNLNTSSTDVSPTTTPCGTPLSGAPKYGTVIPNRIFVGGIAANTTEQELKQFFSAYGAVKDSKIIADRAGVSKGYGFITFENQEDADRIIKKEVSVESDNLVFRDRKLNIGPAIRKQQVLPRAFESPVSPGAVMFSNGVPYTYQNGMAVFASPETGYAVPQAQPQTALMVPQTPPLYLQQPYTYQMPMSYANIQTSPQWAATAAAAAASQWRYMTQSPTTALTATANPYMIAMQPDFMYAQIPQYQTADMGDTTTMFDGTAGVEGSILPVEESLQAANKSTVYVTEGLTSPVHGANLAAATLGCYGSLPLPVVSGYEPVQMTACNSVPVTNNAVPIANATSSITTSANFSTVSASNSSTPLSIRTVSSPSHVVTSLSSKQLPSVCNVNVAPYKKPLTTISRRAAYSTPTFLVRNGNKVQCVMVPQKSLTQGHFTFFPRPPDSITPPGGSHI